MSYTFIKELLNYAEAFESDFKGEVNVANFSMWLNKKAALAEKISAEVWEGKEVGRSVDSIINTSLVHLFRYAKLYSKIAVSDSPFTTIDEVIFLLNLLHRGAMSKKRLIELNIHEKSTGIQIINRLLEKHFIAEDVNELDKRSRTVGITLLGKAALDKNMNKVRQASKLVVADLADDEKIQLAKLLQKMEMFHQEKFKQGLGTNLMLQ